MNLMMHQNFPNVPHAVHHYQISTAIIEADYASSMCIFPSPHPNALRILPVPTLNELQNA